MSTAATRNVAIGWSTQSLAAVPVAPYEPIGILGLNRNASRGSPRERPLFVGSDGRRTKLWLLATLGLFFASSFCWTLAFAAVVAAILEMIPAGAGATAPTDSGTAVDLVLVDGLGVAVLVGTSGFVIGEIAKGAVRWMRP